MEHIQVDPAEAEDNKAIQELPPEIQDDIALFRQYKGPDDGVDALFRDADPARCELWLAASRGGWPEARWLASRCHRLGHAIPEDLREANRLCDLAAQQGEPLALYDLAARYEAGIDAEPDLAKAAALYRRAAAAGVVRAQCQMAECYLRSGAGEWELGEAAKWLRKAAHQGSVAAEDRLTELYIAEGTRAMPSTEGAVWLLRSAERGDPSAQLRLARCYADGEGVAEDRSRALHWYQCALDAYTQGPRELRNIAHCYQGMAELGEAEAQFRLAACLSNGDGVQQDLRLAATWLERAAEQEHAQALLRLPVAYRELGDSLADASGGMHQQEAILWYQEAGSLGDGAACLRLAECYAAGRCVEQRDMPEAVAWFRKAAELAEPMGQFRLGVCYASGDGVERDEREAANWFQRAADAGHAPAQFRFALQLLTGRGVPKDPARGVQYLARAAKQDYVRAQTKLGECYCTGQGIAKNWDAAVAWLGRAAKAGDENAERLLRKYGVRH
ncbi:MAG: sel1 repeat family protein [Candidatus Hydrogenedentes bacterium]|nr:sel1 repeat family protein [Candidatus Hydrogenedentota bacterium]